MSELAYLGLAVLASVIGSLAVWYRQHKPQSLESGVEDFSKGINALARGHEPGAQTRSRRSD